jgi:hypothetical protein
VSWQSWAVAIMFAISFIDRVHTIFKHRRDSISVVALVVVMLWFGALVALLHGGGFW